MFIKYARNDAVHTTRLGALCIGKEGRSKDDQRVPGGRKLVLSKPFSPKGVDKQAKPTEVPKYAYCI